MDNQHQKIKGYRELSQGEIDLMNKIKVKGQELAMLCAEIRSRVSDQTLAAMNDKDPNSQDTETARLDYAEPNRWISVARTDFQTGLMALTRAVAQPTTF